MAVIKVKNSNNEWEDGNRYLYAKKYDTFWSSNIYFRFKFYKI